MYIACTCGKTWPYGTQKLCYFRIYHTQYMFSNVLLTKGGHIVGIYQYQICYC